jgi:ferritin-like protein
MAGRSDVELLEDLLAHEQGLISAYEAALRRQAIDVALGESLRDHESEHARAIERALAGAGSRNPRASVPAPELTSALRSRSSFARFALDLEARARASYAEAAASIRNPRLRQPLGSIMACEAAHEVALRNALGHGLLVD